VRAAARRHGLPEKPPKEHRGIEPPAPPVTAEQLTLL